MPRSKADNPYQPATAATLGNNWTVATALVPKEVDGYEEPVIQLFQVSETGVQNIHVYSLEGIIALRDLCENVIQATPKD